MKCSLGKSKWIMLFFAVSMLLTACKSTYSLLAGINVKSGIDISDKIEHRKISVDNLLLVRKEDGTVWGIYHNIYKDSYKPPQNYKGDVLIKVEGLENIVEVATDTDINMALDSEGDLWEFMYDEDEGCFTEPIKQKNINNVASIYIAHSTIVAIKTDGSVWTWGEGREVFGDEEYSILPKPKKIEGLNKIVGMSEANMRFRYSTFVDYDGNLYVVEDGASHKINDINNIKDLYFLGVLKNDGTLWNLWQKDGARNHPVSERYHLLKLDDIEGIEDIIKVNSKPYTIALDSNGNVWVIESGSQAILEVDKDVVIWEDDLSGYSPVYEFRVSTSKIVIDDVKYVSTASDRIAYVKNDGTVWYRGMSFDPITDYEKNNLDYIIPDSRRTEKNVSVYKVQNVAKQFKYDDGNAFNIFK
jgi:alpha-tubulin suppressor-like RCC1 family protein